MKPLLTALALGLVATSASAQDVNIYPYKGANYCPAGFQPISINGVICCGNPNQNISYQQAMAHPAPKRPVRHQYSARAHCKAGVKGCASD